MIESINFEPFLLKESSSLSLNEIDRKILFNLVRTKNSIFTCLHTNHKYTPNVKSATIQTIAMVVM